VFFSGQLLLGVLSASSLFGGTVSNFEGCYTGATGAPPDGCQGWYTPSVQNTDEASVVTYTYAQGLFQSVLGVNFAADPAGGNNFLGLVGETDGNVDRAQRDVSFSQASVWNVGYDLSVLNANTPGNSSYPYSIGNVSVFNKGSGSAFSVSASWESSAANSTWDAFYNVYSSNNVAEKESPGTAWTGLLQNHWYSEWTTFDQSSNRILSVSITDLTTDTTTTYSPTDWYMWGGTTPQPALNALRISGQNNTVGGPQDAMAVDNVGIFAPEPATLLLMGMGLVALIVFQRRKRLYIAS
jgi:hypothetical protein